MSIIYVTIRLRFEEQCFAATSVSIFGDLGKRSTISNRSGKVATIQRPLFLGVEDSTPYIRLRYSKLYIL